MAAPTGAFDRGSYRVIRGEAEIFSDPLSAINFGPGHLRVESQTYPDTRSAAVPRKPRFASPRTRARRQFNLRTVRGGR